VWASSQVFLKDRRYIGEFAYEASSDLPDFGRLAGSRIRPCEWTHPFENAGPDCQ
jgi:hypothetical protein